MKNIQFCTGFIFHTLSVVVTVKENCHTLLIVEACCKLILKHIGKCNLSFIAGGMVKEHQ